MYPTESQNTKSAGTPFPAAWGPSIDPAGQPAGPRISIVIPSIDRDVQLQACLDAMSRGFPPDAAGGRTINGLPENVWSAAAQLILDMRERDQHERNCDPVFYLTNNIAFPTEPLRCIGGLISQTRNRWQGRRSTPLPNATKR